MVCKQRGDGAVYLGTCEYSVKMAKLQFDWPAKSWNGGLFEDGSSLVKKFPACYWAESFTAAFTSGLSLVHTPSQMNPLLTLPFYCFTIHFNIFLPMSVFQVVLYKFSDQCMLHTLPFLHFDSIIVINVPWIQIVTLLTAQFSPVFLHFMLVWHAYSVSS